MWAVAGIVVGAIVTAIVAVLVGRKFGDQVTKSTNVLVDIQAKQLASMEKALDLQKTLSEGALAMQKEHYDAEVLRLATKAEVDLATMTEERNTYRTTLHDVRGDLGTKLQEAQLKIAELEARPDLTSLLDFEKQSDTRRETFYVKLSSTMEKMIGLMDHVSVALAEHDQRMVGHLKGFVEPVLDAMREVVESCNAMKKNSKRRKAIVERVSQKLRKAAAAHPQKSLA